MEKPGLHRLRSDAALQARLYDGGKELDCFDPETSTSGWCRPSHAGAFTLRATNTSSIRTTAAVAVTPLAATAPCGTEASTRYDAEPVTGTAPNGVTLLCQNFTGLPGERITVDNTPEGGWTPFSWITDGTGERLCPRIDQDGTKGCVLPGQGPYRVLSEIRSDASAYPLSYTQRIRRLSEPAGCAALTVHDFGSVPTTSPGTSCVAFTATATAPHDVYEVPSSTARRLAVYEPDGRTACEAWSRTCPLRAGVRYAVITENPVLVHDRSSGAGCTTADVGGNTNGTFTVPGEVDCLTLPLPEGAHVAGLVSYGYSATPSPVLAVVDGTGEEICSDHSVTTGQCVLTGSGPYRAPVTMYGTLSGSPVTTGTYHVAFHRTDGESACPVLPAGDFTADGPRAQVTIGAEGFAQCLRVTTADARDTLHLGIRDEAGRARFSAYDTNGTTVCGSTAKGCAATGSTAYQVLVDKDWSYAPTYRFDALRIGTAAGPAPECVEVPNVSYGFGPLVDTLNEEHTALCAVLPTAAGDDFDLAFTPPGSVAPPPTALLYSPSSSQSTCSGPYSRADKTYYCSVPGYSEPPVSRPSTLVIGLPAKHAPEPTAVQLTARCADTYCGVEAPGVGTVSPTTGGAGRITVTLTGTALHENDQVAVLGTDGLWRRSTTVSVAPDRHSLTAALDLTGVGVGVRDLSVFTHSGREYRRGTFTVVAPLRSTTAPGVSGTAVVGGQVTANPGTWPLPTDSLAYEWRAHGVAIPGATAAAYTLPPELFGKQLSVAVTARKTGHPVVTATSAGVAAKGVAPKPVKVPAMSGATRGGVRVTAVVGTWSPAPSSYAYQWYANGRAISGATKSWFTLTKAQRGTRITVRVTAYRTGHTAGIAWTRATVAVAG
ncbi:hypothetical protein [Streptomyces sp. NPDC093089]|uniref:hypothetical protein n=1 Tax=Streptomyces sp. NPDC093089 TaxID=3366024 RepID=UPI003821DDB9